MTPGGDTTQPLSNMQTPAASPEELHHNNSLAGEAAGGRRGGYRPSRPTSTHQRPREHTATHDRPRNTHQRRQVGSPDTLLHTGLLVDWQTRALLDIVLCVYLCMRACMHQLAVAVS